MCAQQSTSNTLLLLGLQMLNMLLALLILSNIFRVCTIISTYCVFLFSVYPLFQYSFFFSYLTPCWVCMCVIWVDVQTGCVWAGVPLSVHLFAALILGFVCSIWAKFSNGDNYRGRPGERRRWVLPFNRVSCMLLQASQLHLPASPVSLSISVTVFVIKGPVDHWVCCLTTQPFIVTVLSQTNSSLCSAFNLICFTRRVSEFQKEF